MSSEQIRLQVLPKIVRYQQLDPADDQAMDYLGSLEQLDYLDGGYRNTGETRVPGPQGQVGVVVESGFAIRVQ